MKMHAKIHMAALCTFFCIQSMEIIQSHTTVPTFKIDNNLIANLINSSKQNKSDPNLFHRRTKRLHLLENLLNQNAEISFSNNNDTIAFWLNKKDDNMIHNILYEKLLSFISCNIFKHTVHVEHTRLSRKYPFNATFQLDCSLLHITIAQPPTEELLKTISKFLDQYSVKNNTYNFFDKHHQEHTTDQPHEHSQASNEEKEEDTIDFAQLPDATQRLLEEIFQDMDNT